MIFASCFLQLLFHVGLSNASQIRSCCCELLFLSQSCLSLFILRVSMFDCLGSKSNYGQLHIQRSNIDSLWKEKGKVNPILQILEPSTTRILPRLVLDGFFCLANKLNHPNWLMLLAFAWVFLFFSVAGRGCKGIRIGWIARSFGKALGLGHRNYKELTVEWLSEHL